MNESPPPTLTTPVIARFRFAAAATACLASILLSGCGRNFTPRNHAPVIKAQPDTAVVTGDTLRLQAVATDDDWDQITYKAIVRVSPQEMRAGYQRALMNFYTGRFWYAPSYRDPIERTIWFVADDGRGGTDTTMFVVRVKPRPRAAPGENSQ